MIDTSKYEPDYGTYYLQLLVYINNEIRNAELPYLITHKRDYRQLIDLDNTKDTLIIKYKDGSAVEFDVDTKDIKHIIQMLRDHFKDRPEMVEILKEGRYI